MYNSEADSGKQVIAEDYILNIGIAVIAGCFKAEDGIWKSGTPGRA
jgi:hypothetical protein